MFSSEVFNGFLVSAQLETQSASPEQVSLDVYLLNNYRVSVTVSSTLQTDDVLEVRRRPFYRPILGCPADWALQMVLC